MVKVLSRNEWRAGRGFSLMELEAAGVKPFQAKRMGLRLDVRRRTSHDFNVEELKKIAANAATAEAQRIAKPKRERRSAEEVKVKPEPVAGKRRSAKAKEKGTRASEGKKKSAGKSSKESPTS